MYLGISGRITIGRKHFNARCKHKPLTSTLTCFLISCNNGTKSIKWKKTVWLSACCAPVFDVPTYPTSRPVTTETTPVFLIFYHQYIDTHHFLLHIVNHSPSYIKATLVSAVIISNVLSSHCAPNKPFKGVFTAAICYC